MLGFIIAIIWLISYIIPKENANYNDLFYFKNVTENKINSVCTSDVNNEPVNENLAKDITIGANDISISVDTPECSNFLDKNAEDVLNIENLTPSAFAKSIYDEL